MLIKYSDNQKSKVKEEEFEPSGIACGNHKCKGEMMIYQPVNKHPTLPLKRARCGICKWLGWI